MNVKYSPTVKMYFCFRLKVTLCVNDGFNSNSSSEEEVEYSAASFLTVGCSHPKMKEQNYQRKKNKTQNCSLTYIQTLCTCPEFHFAAPRAIWKFGQL